jgi:hypothetical protein
MRRNGRMSKYPRQQHRRGVHWHLVPAARRDEREQAAREPDEPRQAQARSCGGESQAVPGAAVDRWARSLGLAPGHAALA